ncbi:MAG: tetratricopeptide repeat protein [Planctomycetaceae bacterium]
MRWIVYFSVGLASIATLPVAFSADEVCQQTTKLRPALEQRLEALNARLAQGPADVQFYSQRGDVHFFLGKFPAALADYDKMLELDPSLLALHWRRGLAQFYVGQYSESAKQFERYFEQDQSDRENGIWRFYAQVRELGLDEARRKLLPYDQPDRAPLPDIYDLCRGTLTAAVLESRLTGEGLSASELAKREFYGHLYLGLDYAVKDQPEPARQHLDRALASDWAQSSGYGPNYMWHIARLQRDLLSQEAP